MHKVTNKGLAASPKKMKVLYIDGSIGFGGAPKSLSLLLSGLKNVDPILLTSVCKDVRDKWFDGIRIYRRGLISNYHLKMRVKEWLISNIKIKIIHQVVFKFLAFLDLIERYVGMVQIFFISKYHRVQIIHMNTACMPLEGLFMAQLLDIPSVSHIRGFLNSNEQIFMKNIRLASRIIGVSEAVSKTIYHIKDFQFVSTIYDPVDIKLFDDVYYQREEVRLALGLKDTDIAVGIFGRVVSWKGQREFVYACMAAMDKNLNIMGFIIGDHSDMASTYFISIKKIISESGLKDRFILTGYREDVERLCVAMDIVVHASIEPEPYGMVIPEGMAARKPVIATDAGGPSEIINSGVDGILLPPGNVEKMSEAILELANDPLKRDLMGKNGYQKVKKHLTIENAATKIEKIYLELIQSKF